MVDEFEIEADPPEILSIEELTIRRKMMHDKITEAFKEGWEEEQTEKDGEQDT